MGIGKLAGVEYVVFGMLSKSDEGMYQLEAGIVDVAAEGVVKTQKVGTDSLLQLAELVDALALKLAEAVGRKGEAIVASGSGAGVQQAERRQQDEQRLEELRAKKRSWKRKYRRCRRYGSGGRCGGGLPLGWGLGREVPRGIRGTREGLPTRTIWRRRLRRRY